MKKMCIASLLSFSLILVTCFAGCAKMRNCLGGACGDGSCGPQGCSAETNPQTAPGFFQSGGGSDVFGGNISSPARGSSFGGGFGGSGTR